MRWSEEQTVIFVKIYLQHEYLWNNKHEHYGNKYMRKKAYKNIGSIFGASTNIWLEEREVMAKLKILGSTYAQEVAKIKKKAEAGQEYTPAMKWFQYWYRCKHYNEPFSSDIEHADDQKIWILTPDNRSNGDHDTSHEGDTSMSLIDERNNIITKSDLDESLIPDSESENLVKIEDLTDSRSKSTHSNIKPRWGEDQTVKFVRLYIKNDVLWNTNHHNFRKKKIRQKAFSNLRIEFKDATGIDLSEQEIRLKIRSLQSTYAQERTKIKYKSSPDWTYKSTLKWFPDWDRYFGPKKSHQDECDEASEDQKIWLELSDHEDDEEEKSNETSHRTKRWGEQDTVKFVKIYLQYKFLYNPKHKYFRQKKLRHEAYSNISSEFETLTGIKLNEKELKAKINVLGSTYAQELSKIKKRAGTSNPYTPAMKWFRYWHKYKYEMQQRNARLAMNENQEEEEEESLLKFDDDDDDDDDNNNDEEEEEELKADPELEDLPSPHAQDSQFETKRKRMKTEHAADTYRISPDFVDTNSLSSRISNGSREDEFERYGKYIAEILRTMSIDKALQVQLEIQSLLSDERGPSS